MLNPEAVVLAAGASRRFGSPKALASWGETCLLGHAIQTAAAAVQTAPWVVLGAAAEEIEAALQPLCLQYRPLRAADWTAGLSASLQVAIRAIETQSSATAALVLLGDQPVLQPADLQQLITLWRSDPDQPVAAEYAGHVGAPCILPRRMFASVQTLRGDQGARTLLRSAAGLRCLPLAAAAWDVDTPEDLRTAWSRLKAHGP